MTDRPPVVVNGWTLLSHPAFEAQLRRLREAVEAEVDRGKAGTANQKLAAALAALVLRTIPADPTDSRFRQGKTLGVDHTHWFRAKFGNGRFRLFFRFDSRARVIIYAWVNDRDTLRTRGSKTDAYAAFRRMLESGDPPTDWEELVARARPLPGGGDDPPVVG